MDEKQKAAERHFAFRTRGERPEMVALFRTKGFPTADSSTDREDSSYNVIDNYTWFRFSTTSDGKVNEVSQWIRTTAGVRTEISPDGLPNHFVDPSFFQDSQSVLMDRMYAALKWVPWEGP